MLMVGLTGGIASGKSTVCRMLEERNIPVICTDTLAHAAVAKGSPVLARIREAFGDGVIGSDGELDREAVAQIVFNDETKRRALEGMIHPWIGSEVQRMANELEHAGHGIVVVDVPLLYEVKWDANFDTVIVVYVPTAVQEQRLLERDSMSPEQARARIDAQLPMEDKKGRADIVIDNSGDIDQTRDQVNRAIEYLETLAGSAQRPKTREI